MNTRHYRSLRAAITLFVSFLVSVAVMRQNFLLSVFAVGTGMLFLMAVRAKARITVDERERTVREKAAQMTYAIFAPTIATGALLLLMPYQKLSPVFAKGEFIYLESLGIVFAYLGLFLIALYAVFYHYYNRKFGGSGDEE